MSLFQPTIKHGDYRSLLTADSWSARDFLPTIAPVVRRLVPDAVTVDDAEEDQTAIICPRTLRGVRLEASATALTVHYSADGDSVNTEQIDFPLSDTSRLALLSGLALRIAADLTFPTGGAA